MITRFTRAALAAVLLASSFAWSLSPSEIPSDTPIASLVSSAKSNLAQGNAIDALVYFDAAIQRDPHNYLTIYQRATTYLSLGRNTHATRDLDKVLAIRPNFEGALLQRAKIKKRNADWKSAREDYEAAGKADGAEIAQLEEAQGAASLAAQAEKAGDWEGCVSHAGIAIMVASTSLSLRQMRSRCRFERGEVLEGVSDLAHVVKISPGSTAPYMQMSSMLFYSAGDLEKGMEQIRKCLHSDPDSKACSKLYRQEKKIDKALKEINALKGKRQIKDAVTLLVGEGEETGLIEDVKEAVKSGKQSGHIHPKSPNELYATLIELACELYTDITKKQALPYCTEALDLKPHSLPALLSLAQRQFDAGEYEASIQTLNKAHEHHPSSNRIGQLLQKAQVQLKRSKTKDYYKVLNVANDADDRTIKRQYRTLTKQFHPDKAISKGISKEQAEKKMAQINEAYEVLSDPELRARFDRGDDPNSQEHQGSPFHGSPFGQGAGGQQFFFQQGFKFQQGGGAFYGFP